MKEFEWKSWKSLGCKHTCLHIDAPPRFQSLWSPPEKELRQSVEARIQKETEGSGLEYELEGSDVWEIDRWIIWLGFWFAKQPSNKLFCLIFKTICRWRASRWQPDDHCRELTSCSWTSTELGHGEAMSSRVELEKVQAMYCRLELGKAQAMNSRIQLGKLEGLSYLSQFSFLWSV